MIGNGYWATGITVSYEYSGGGQHGWRAVIEFCDDGFAGDDHAGRVSTEGKLTTRYAIVDTGAGDALTAAVDATPSASGSPSARLRTFTRTSTARPRDTMTVIRRTGGNWSTRRAPGLAGKEATSAPDPLHPDAAPASYPGAASSRPRARQTILCP